MSQFSIQEQRPPYVTFEERAVEDREASLEAGRMIMKSEFWAMIYPQGSKDCNEREVTEWFDSLKQRASMKAIPRAWVDEYMRMFEEFKSGQEVSPNGTHVKNWPAIDKATAMNLVSARILTVEDCAAMNEESMRRVGMGARTLKEKAQNWIKAGNSRKAAAELEKLQADNAALAARNASLEEQVRALAVKVEALTSKEI